jgi:hypothetical protein
MDLELEKKFYFENGPPPRFQPASPFSPARLLSRAAAQPAGPALPRAPRLSRPRPTRSPARALTRTTALLARRRLRGILPPTVADGGCRPIRTKEEMCTLSEHTLPLCSLHSVPLAPSNHRSGRTPPSAALSRPFPVNRSPPRPTS